MNNIKLALIGLSTLVMFSFFFTSCQQETMNTENQVTQKTEESLDLTSQELEQLWGETTSEEQTSTEVSSNKKTPTLPTVYCECDWITGIIPATIHNSHFINWVGGQAADLNFSGGITAIDVVRMEQILEAYDADGDGSITGYSDFNIDLPVLDIPYDVNGDGLITYHDNVAAFILVSTLKKIAVSVNYFNQTDINCVFQLLSLDITCP